ncbi:MAG: DUF2961 domain-containing protein [Pontiellaceae bacterium]|nr:DUF2961 domain-containing protein [Pontiellaceae bacterium]MBN2785777.1 DUF2961 domain-containing protein [Pontiellaceae bacterium]
MKELIKIILAVIVCLPISGLGGRLYGLDRMEHFDQLPYLLEGTMVRQMSSRDRNGGNDDGHYKHYSSLYTEESGEMVIFDDMGPGCVYRFWCTFSMYTSTLANSDLKFYFDNEPVPRIHTTVGEFFNGIGAPFEFPLTGDFNTSSRGCYCYLPFPYRERLKITVEGDWLYYNITYHKFDSADGIETWTGNEDQSAVMAQWNAAGTDPKPASSNLVVSGNLSLDPGTSGVLFSETGGGVVQSIRINPLPSGEDILSNIRLQMSWDGGAPEVDVPIGDFFGSGRNEIEVSSLPIGMSVSNDWYCYFPMPYWESAEIEVVNNGSESLVSMPFEVQYLTNEYDRARAGYFHTCFHENAFVRDKTDFNFISEQGRGHVVGVSLFMECSGGLTYLEGDERAYVDGSLSPCIYGTGNEDYFNGGYYFGRGEFTLPYHGNPWKNHLSSPCRTQAYRFHLSDLIPFDTSIHFGIEHGIDNSSAGTYSSVTYYYMQEGSGKVLTADLDLRDSWAENVYTYVTPETGICEESVWHYEGDQDDIAISDQGYTLTNGITEFTTPVLDDSTGLLLRRRMDQGIGGQRADIYVDGTFAGVWYDGDYNFSAVNKRWLDSEFLIPSALLSGKRSVRISIVPESSVWNEYHYWTFCMKPLLIEVDSDNDRLPDAYELETFSSLDRVDGNLDTDEDGFSDWDEYICGTDPTDPASFFVVDSSHAFHSRIGRLYTLLQSTNLLSDEWVAVRSGIPGTGWDIAMPVQATNHNAYFRLQVDLP